MSILNDKLKNHQEKLSLITTKLLYTAADLVSCIYHLEQVLSSSSMVNQQLIHHPEVEKLLQTRDKWVNILTSKDGVFNNV